MKRTLVLITIVAALSLALGACKKKKDDGDKGGKEKSGMTGGGGGGAIGIADCDEALKQRKCLADATKGDVKAGHENVVKEQADAWRKMAKSASGRDILKTACKTALDGWKSVLGSSPAGKKCFK